MMGYEKVLYRNYGSENNFNNQNDLMSFQDASYSCAENFQSQSREDNLYINASRGLDEGKAIDDSYEINVIGRQIITPVASGISNSFAAKISAEGQYKVLYTQYKTNPKDPYFKGWHGSFFEEDKKLSKISEKVYMNNGSDKNNELSDIRKSGAKLQYKAGNMLLIPQLVRLGVNGFAVSDDSFSELVQKSPDLASVVVLDSTSVVSNITDAAVYNQGLRAVSKGKEALAVKFLTTSHRINIASSALQMGSGAMRVYSEYENYQINHDLNDVNSSSVFYGALDFGNGGCGAVYSAHLLSRSSRAVSSSVQVNNVLMGAVRLSVPMSVTLKGFGLVGVVIGLGTNTYSIYDAYNNASLTETERNRIYISNSISAFGSTMIGLSILTMTFPPASAVFLIIGTGVLIASTLYDYQMV